MKYTYIQALESPDIPKVLTDMEYDKVRDEAEKQLSLLQKNVVQVGWESLKTRYEKAYSKLLGEIEQKYWGLVFYLLRGSIVLKEDSTPVSGSRPFLSRDAKQLEWYNKEVNGHIRMLGETGKLECVFDEVVKTCSLNPVDVLLGQDADYIRLKVYGRYWASRCVVLNNQMYSWLCNAYWEPDANDKSGKWSIPKGVHMPGCEFMPPSYDVLSTKYNQEAKDYWLLMSEYFANEHRYVDIQAS